MIEILSGTWAAGETKTFHINGQRLEILDAQYALDVYLMDKSGAQMSIMKNSEASFFSQPKEGFNSLQIYSAQAQFIRFFVGSGDAGTRRISSTVQIIDGERARALAGMAFLASTYQAAVAATNSYCQVFNPAGSGRRVIVNSVTMSSSLTTPVSLGFSTNVLTGDVTSGRSSSRLSGSPLGVALVKTQASGAALLTGNLMFNVNLPAGAPVLFQPKGAPLIVLPGYSLMAFANNVNVDLTASFEFTEEVI
ncbi:hypothetical protein [Variovorax sp. RCC_210]|uniref:hypothetical protein n=1 Tax=Variovorax sp. RCC_210 TaxID=3239217 RepID=UPI003523B13D